METVLLLGIFPVYSLAFLLARNSTKWSSSKKAQVPTKGHLKKKITSYNLTLGLNSVLLERGVLSQLVENNEW